MSRPGNCWRCGVDPSDWWVKIGELVWCSTCLDFAAALARVVAQFDLFPMIAETLRARDEGHLANEIERQSREPADLRPIGRARLVWP